MRTIDMKNILYSHSNKIHLHKKVTKGVVLSLVLKVSVFVTRKWPTRPEIVPGIVSGDTQVRYMSIFPLP